MIFRGITGVFLTCFYFLMFLSYFWTHSHIPWLYYKPGRTFRINSLSQVKVTQVSLYIGHIVHNCQEARLSFAQSMWLSSGILKCEMYVCGEYIYIYVCVCVCVYIYIHTYTYIYIYNCVLYCSSPHQSGETA